MEEIAKAVSHVKALAVLDKAESLSACGGPLFTEVTSGMTPVLMRCDLLERFTPHLKAVSAAFLLKYGEEVSVTDGR